MKTAIAAIVLALLSTVEASAQSTPIKIKVDAENNTPSQNMRSLVMPKISADSHFALVSDSSFDVLLTVACMDIHAKDGSALGTICADSYVFMPDGYFGLSASTPASLSIGTLDYMAGTIFTDLLDYSTPDNMKARLDILNAQLGNIIKAVREYDQKSGPAAAGHSGT